MPKLEKKSYYKKLYLQREKLGLCIKCQNKAVHNRYCQNCYDKLTNNQKMRRSRNKQNNICCSCGENQTDNRTECEVCSTKRREKYRSKSKSGLCTQCNRNNSMAKKKTCSDCSQRASKRYVESGEVSRRKKKRQKNRRIVLSHYGGKCVCCREEIQLLLNIDHINNNGRSHRKQLGSSDRIYQEIIDCDFPSEYQILCYNCNIGKYLNGGICPHNNQNGV